MGQGETHVAFFRGVPGSNPGRHTNSCDHSTRGADKSLARPGRKQATATEDFDVRVSDL